MKKQTKIDKHRILKELNSNGESRKFIDYVNRAKKVFKNELIESVKLDEFGSILIKYENKIYNC